MFKYVTKTLLLKPSEYEEMTVYLGKTNFYYYYL